MRNLILLLSILIIQACAQNDLSKKNITDFASPAEGNSSLPFLTVGDDGQLHLSWVQKNEEGIANLKTAWLSAGENWQSTESIASGDNWFVNWADYPSINVNKAGDKISHYLAKSNEATFSYNINVVRKKSSSDWSEAMVPHKDGTLTEHGFVTVLPQDDNSFVMAWLDGRNTGGGDEHGDGGHGGGGAMTLRTAVMDIDGNLTEEYELDPKICDCCQTSGAITNNGPVFVYRDRSENEIRDMSIVRRVNGEWTSPKTIFDDNWEIAGCPVNGPTIAANGNNLAIAWFSAPDEKPQVKVVFSNDGGESFSSPIMIDNQTAIGRVDVEIDNNGKAYVSWLSKDAANNANIKVVAVNVKGKLGNDLIVSETKSARSSGFPQMALFDGSLYFAWTDLSGENKTQIRTSRIRL